MKKEDKKELDLIDTLKVLNIFLIKILLKLRFFFFN